MIFILFLFLFFFTYNSFSIFTTNANSLTIYNISSPSTQLWQLMYAHPIYYNLKMTLHVTLHALVEFVLKDEVK